MTALRTLTVVRFPSGDWSGGGLSTDPDYQHCEVYLMPAENFAKAKRQAQSARARLVKNGLPLPTQAAPFRKPE